MKIIIIFNILILGITEIDFVSLNPHIVDKFRVKHDFGAVQADGILYNIKSFGYSASSFQKFSGFDKNILEVHLKMPKFSLSGFYKATVEVLGFKINDEGPMALNFCEFL